MLGLMTGLDLCYTLLYAHIPPRNKFQYLRQMQPQRIDYVFLGSSRTANHIVPDIVTALTGKKALNLGVEGAGLADNLLTLKMLIDRKIEIKHLYLQVDYVYNSSDVTLLGNTDALPFIHDDVVSTHLKGKMKDFYPCYYIPFYRYMVSDHRLGVREAGMSLARRAPRTDLQTGYVALEGHTDSGPVKLPREIARSNTSLDEILSICKSRKIRLTLFCAPFYPGTDTAYISALKKRLPGFHDFSGTITNPQLFYNSGHLNREGALKFTEMLIRETE